MSVINLILSQKIIVISLAAALLLMAVAVLLTVVGRWRANAPKRAQRHAERQARLAMDEQIRRPARTTAQPVEDDNEEAPVVGKRSRPATKQVSGSAPAQVAETPEAGATPTKTAAPSIHATPAPAAAHTGAASVPKPAVQAEPVAVSDMQNILSSVFVDDDLLARYQVLLQGLDNIDISDLLALCQTVAAQLGAGGQPAGLNKEHS